MQVLVLVIAEQGCGAGNPAGSPKEAYALGSGGFQKVLLR